MESGPRARSAIGESEDTADAFFGYRPLERPAHPQSLPVINEIYQIAHSRVTIADADALALVRRWFLYGSIRTVVIAAGLFSALQATSIPYTELLVGKQRHAPPARMLLPEPLLRLWQNHVVPSGRITLYSLYRVAELSVFSIDSPCT